MDPREVEALRVAYNKEHPHETPVKKGDGAWSDMTRRMKDSCKTGTPECIVHSLVQKPDAPMSWNADPMQWLSSDDIDDSQKYYQKLIPDYYYTGSVPIDFDLHSETGSCLVSSLCSMKLPELYKKGYRRVGIVFNTDPHNAPGEHWIAAFLDMRPELENAKMTYSVLWSGGSRRWMRWECLRSRWFLRTTRHVTSTKMLSVECTASTSSTAVSLIFQWTNRFPMML